MLELSDSYCKVTMINMLKDLVEKVSNMYEHMENYSRGKDAIKKNLNGSARNEKWAVRHAKVCGWTC